MASDIFDKVEISKQEDIFDTVSAQPKSEEQIDVTGDSEQVSEETFMGELPRRLGQYGTRFLEGFAGAPGEIQSLGSESMKWLSEKFGGPVSEEEFARRKEVVKGAPSPLPEEARLPTTEDLRETGKSFLGERFEPKGKVEEAFGETAEDIGSLLFPLGGKVKLLRPALVGLGSNAVKAGVGAVGGGEKAQTYAKLGAMFLSNLLGKGSARKLGKDLYAEAEKALPEGTKVSANKLGKNILKLEQRLAKGGSNPSKTPVQTKVNEIKAKIKNGKIDISELQEFKRDVNDVSSALYDLPKDVKGRLRSNFNALRNDLRETINEYGKKNPKFLDSWNKAEEVHSAIAQSKKARNFISKVLKKNIPLSGASALYVAFNFASPLAKAAVSVAAVTIAGETAAKIWKSPTIRKHYMNVIKGAMKESSAAVSKNLHKLNKELEEAD